MRQLFIAWVPFQRRSLSMRSYFSYELEFLSFAFKNRLLRPLEYLWKTWKTLTLLLTQRPQVLWIQLPPTPLLYLAYLYQLLLCQQALLVADCHNAAFRSPWIRFPGAVTLLNRCDAVIVHNDWVKSQAIALGLSETRLWVLEDPPAAIASPPDTAVDEFQHPWIIFPCSFNRDEPIQAVLDAARLAPELTFVLTGNTARAQGIHDLSNVPENVRLPGFLPEEDFNRLLHNTDIVLGLTTLDGIQLSVANEALGIGKPMVLSDTKTLKSLFHKGAVYVSTLSAEAIAQGCRSAMQSCSVLAQEVQDLRREREAAWQHQAVHLKTFLTRDAVSVNRNSVAQ